MNKKIITLTICAFITTNALPMFSQLTKKKVRRRQQYVGCNTSIINNKKNPFIKSTITNMLNQLHSNEFNNIVSYAPDPMGFNDKYINNYLNEQLKHTPKNDNFYNDIIENFLDNKFEPTKWHKFLRLYEKPYSDQTIKKDISPRKYALDIYAKQQIITNSLHSLQQNYTPTDRNIRKTVEALLYEHLPKKHVLVDETINFFYTNYQFRQHFSYKVFCILFDDLKGHLDFDDAEYAFIIDHLPLNYLIGLLMAKTKKNTLLQNNDVRLDVNA